MHTQGNKNDNEVNKVEKNIKNAKEKAKVTEEGEFYEQKKKHRYRGRKQQYRGKTQMKWNPKNQSDKEIILITSLRHWKKNISLKIRRAKKS